MHPIIKPGILLLGAFALAACSTSPGTRPSTFSTPDLTPIVVNVPGQGTTQAGNGLGSAGGSVQGASSPPAASALPTLVPSNTQIPPAGTGGGAPPPAPAGAATPSSGQTPVARRIQFQPGATTATVQGSLPAGGTDRWVVNAAGGQMMQAGVAVTSGQAILVVFGADGNVLQSDHAESPVFNGTLPTTQDYTLDVRGSPNAATNYTLSITIPPLGSSPAGTSAPQRIQFAPGTSGATVQGTVPPNGVVRYVLYADTGYSLQASVSYSGGQAFLVAIAANGAVLVGPNLRWTHFSVILPATGDQIVEVHGTGNAPTPFTLTVVIPPR
ncbi:MAG: hypothetical protein ACM3JD_11570 [Rudaea sp.]